MLYSLGSRRVECRGDYVEKSALIRASLAQLKAGVGER
jgi:hypothetical protein